MTRRWTNFIATLLVAAVGEGEALAETNVERRHLQLYVDNDDDDGNGIPDRDDTGATAADVEWITSPAARVRVRKVSGDSVRVIAGKRVGLQGIRVGRSTLELGVGILDVTVCEVTPGDEKGPVNPATSHASLSRTLPDALANAGDAEDDDALTWFFTCPKGALPHGVRIQSTRPNGDRLDAIESAALLPDACPPMLGEGFECARTERIRATVDLVDRTHPVISGRSLRAEVGGRIRVEAFDRKATSIRVGGPRATPRGPLGRYRGKLRFHVVRAAPRGQPAVGSGADASAGKVVREEARTVSMLWGQCGIHFGSDEQIAVDIVDPPPQYMAAVGCDLGTPASGGTVTLGVGTESVSVSTRRGDSPVVTAHALAAAAAAKGFRAVVNTNARIQPGALRTADVSFRRASGDIVGVHALPGVALSTDETLRLCLGEVNLSDGLSHFDDLDAAAGTLEERALVRAYQDDDPSTIEVFIVPSFSKTGRIGESFIDADGTSIQNAVIVDRAGIRSGARSYALAHEIGHVLLDMPGHPDDFGVDRPWVLMDADAADSTIFGPRRLSIEDCDRALMQSGPGAMMPLLERWPLYETRAKRAAPVKK